MKWSRLQIMTDGGDVNISGENIFTYGSLMFDSIWLKVVEGFYDKVNARLYGYKRRRVKDVVYPALLPGTERDYVDGVVYLNVNKRDILALDAFEGNFYYRKLVDCQFSDGKKITAWAYMFKKKFRTLIEEKEWDPIWFSKVGINHFLKEYDGFR